MTNTISYALEDGKMLTSSFEKTPPPPLVIYISVGFLGEYASAIETLVTAISLIKQSKVANDDRCKILTTTLQDTLQGIETKSFTAGSSRDKYKGRNTTVGVVM